MKWLGIILTVFGANLASLAQTDALAQTNVLARTNVYIMPTITIGPPASTNIPATYTNALTTYTNAVAPNARRLSLEDCVRMTLEHNLDLQIERYNPQIALFVLNAAYGGFDPSLSLSGQHDHNESGNTVIGTNVFTGRVGDDNNFSSTINGLSPLGTTYTLQGGAIDTYGNFREITSSSASASVNQPLLKNFWIDSTRLTIRVNKNRLKYSELQLKLQIINTLTTLEQAYDDLIYDRENVVVQQKAVQLAETLVSENEKRLQVGALAPLDLASAQAQAAQNRAAVIAAKSQLATQERKLKQFITDEFSQWADIALEPSGTLAASYQLFDRQHSWSKGLTQRSELLQAKLDAEKAGIQLKYDRNQLFPALDVFATYGYNGTGREFSGSLGDLQQRDLKEYTYGGKITLPLGNITARNVYKSDKAALQQIVLTIKRWERDIMIAIDNDIGTLQADYDQVMATRAQRLYEEQALDAEQKKLENGKSTTYSVLLVQRDLTTARGAELQALDTYNKDLAMLSQDEGSTLERLGINLDVK